jgi:hypothetical protein
VSVGESLERIVGKVTNADALIAEIAAAAEARCSTARLPVGGIL